MKRLIKNIMIFSTIILGLLGFTYYIDADEASDLASQVQTALEAWLSLDATLEFEEAQTLDTAEAIIRLGDATRFGPDLLSLTTQSQNEQRQTIVLIAPEQASNQRVLRHELGLLLGLSSSDQGIMKPAVQTQDSAELSESDAQTLNATVNAEKEDINRDGQINYYDLVALAQAFGTSSFGSAADLNEDGIVDIADLALLQEVYTFSAPSVNPPSSPETADPLEDILEPTPDPNAEAPPTSEENPEAVNETPAEDGSTEPTQETPNQDNPDETNPTGETNQENPAPSNEANPNESEQTPSPNPNDSNDSP